MGGHLAKRGSTDGVSYRFLRLMAVVALDPSLRLWFIIVILVMSLGRTVTILCSGILHWTEGKCFWRDNSSLRLKIFRNKSAFASDPQVSLQPLQQLTARGQFHRVRPGFWVCGVDGILPTLVFFLKNSSLYTMTWTLYVIWTWINLLMTKSP